MTVTVPSATPKGHRMFPGTRCFPVGKTSALPCGSSLGFLGCAVGKEGMASSHLDKTKSFQVWNGGSKHPKILGLFPDFIPFRSGTGRKCQSCAGNRETLGMPKLGAGSGNFWECGFGKIWEGHVVIPWEKHPKGIPPEQGWRRAAVP